MNDNAKSNAPRLDAEEILAGIRRWVEIETPSHDAAAVNRLVDLSRRACAHRRAAHAHARPRRFGDVLLARRRGTPTRRRRHPLLGHLDTVHPIGALATTHRFRKEGDASSAPASTT